MRHNILTLTLSSVFVIAAWSASAASYDNPNMVSVENASGQALKTFSTEQLKAEFPQQTYDTRTPWTKDNETIVYRGPKLKDVLAKGGISENPGIKIVAYDNFVSEVRGDEIEQFEPILAVERKCTDDDRAKSLCKGGQEFRPINMLEKGPIFVVWPYDRLPSDYVPARNSIWVFFPVALRSVQ